MKKKDMPKEEDPTLADIVGSGFALVQHGIDIVIEKGMKAIDNAGKNADADSIQNPTARKAAKMGKGFASFLGKAGEAYFKTYGDLKKKK